LTFEQAFSDTERAATASAKGVSLLAKATKQLQKAALAGDIPQIRKSSERLLASLEATRQEIANARSAWCFNPEEEETYLRETYTSELLEAARNENVQIEQRDEGLVAFPSIIRVLASDRALRINKKKVQAIRPSYVLKMLKAIQARKPRATPEAFLEVAHRAYRLLVGEEYGRTVALKNIYDVLTLLPGSANGYDQTDFVRDLFLLDQSGVVKTRSGAICSLPASTGTKGTKGTFSFVSPNGEPVTYYGLRFSEVTQ